MRNRLNIIRHDEDTRTLVASYGLDPVKVEEWILERAPSHADPTAAEAIYRADRDLARRRRRNA